ncbi:MAG: ABC transporter ATP-binding protein/permease [Clostridia bacterium]|nr:ABC transporter ATP-binding protein/permease [Clostridia bacterium]
MIKLLRFMLAYPKECFVGTLFKLLEASFELIVPLIVKAIIDNGISSGDKPYVVRMALVLVLLGLVGLVCAISAQYFAAKAATGFAAKLKSKLFGHLQSLSYTEVDTLGTSAVITRLTGDSNTIQNGVNLVLRLFLRSPFIVFGAMIMAFTIDGKSALTFAAAIPVLSVVVFGIMLITIPLYKKVQKQLDRVLSVTRENLHGARVIRAFRKEQDEIACFEDANDTLTTMQKFVGRISALTNPLTYVIINLAVIMLLQISAHRVDEGTLTQGDVVALYNYMSQILVELIKLANLLITITRSFASGARVQQVFEMTPSMTFPATSPAKVESDNAVEFRNVALTYKNAGAPSVSGVSFTAKRGQTIGVIGGTGSGKSTLVNLIPRFYDATEGEILIDGIPIRDYKMEDLRDKIGIVPQKAVLFKGTIADNLRWGKADATDEELNEAVRLAQASDVIKAKEKGLYEPVAQSGRNFSGGQRQRLTIARALVRKPEILILDDSASALDYATDAALRKSLRELPGTPTVFIVSQRASSIRHADLIIVLDDGEVVGKGTHEELLDSCPVYREIYESQFDSKQKEVRA